MSVGFFICLLFLGLIIGLATGHPIAFVLGGISIILGLIGVGPDIMNIFINGIIGTMNNYTLVAIPLFVLMANFLSSSAIAENLFDSIQHLVGRVRGGLAIAVITVSTIFAATTGVVGASVVTMGVLAIPVLLKYGYSKELSTGVVAAGGTLGILIPPSIMLIVMGTQTNVSVGDLFKASIIPGLLLAFAYCVYVFIVCFRNPDNGPAISKEEYSSVPMKKVVRDILLNLIPPVILVAAVLGTIFTGIVTPTEASGAGAFTALLLTFFYKKFSFKMLTEAVYDTAKTTAMVLIILIGATAFASVFLAVDGSSVVENAIQSVGLGKWGIFIVMLLITFVLGMFIDWIGIVMIVFPIFMPILEGYDFNILWVVIVVSVLLQTAFLTPPFGYSLFYIKGIVPSSITLGTIYKGIVPFVIIIVLITALVMVFPNIILWLPSVLAS